MTHRRGFLKAATAAAVAAPAILSATSAAAGAGTLPAIDPIARNGKPKFKFSLAAYSYRSLLQGENASLELSDFINDCAEFGLEGTELTSYYFPEAITPAFLRKLKRQCFRLGLDVSGTAVRNDFGHPDGEARRRDIAHVKRWIDYAEILGAPVIRIFAGHRKDGTTEAQSHDLIVSGIEECCEYAGQHGVHLALENHGGPTSTAEGLLKIVRDVQSPWFGVNLDTGNFRTEDPYGDLAKAAPYALNVQVKVAIAGPEGRKEETDYQRLATILRDAHYRGYVVLEFEESGDPKEKCREHIAKLREAFLG